MKRFVALLIMAVYLVTGMLNTYAVTQPKEITVQVDGLPVNFDVAPVIQNGRTLVPFRAIAEALNVNVVWDDRNRTISASNAEVSVKLKIGDKTAYSNNNSITLDVSPSIINGRTLIPLRFFSEAFRCKVSWDDATRKIGIVSPLEAMDVIGFYALGDKETSSWSDLFSKDYPETDKGNADMVSDVALGWYSLDEKGNLLTNSKTGWKKPDGFEKVLEAAQKYKLKTEMVVHMLDGDGSITKLLASDTTMEKAVYSVVYEAAQYQGVNLDLEGLGLSDKGEALIKVQQSFTKFASLLSKELKKSDLKLILSLHAPNSAYKGYDYKALGEIADKIIIMAYDYGVKPEPVNLVNEAVETAKKSVPPDKLVLGISVPNETAESIQTKIGIAKRNSLSGIALWRLGLVSDPMWENMRAMINPHDIK